IAETLESQFAEIAESQPELLARHCTNAGLIEKAARLWGKAGQRSLARSALVEAAAQLTRALAQIAALPATKALRREGIQLMIGHRLMGTSLLFTGDIAQGRTHCDAAIALYDPVAHRPLATSFGQDVRVSILCYRSWALWVLGYPDAALADTGQVLKDARE